MTRLTFTPGNHIYWLADPTSGKKTAAASVTGLLALLDKPALKRWAANTAADYATDHWDELAGMAPSARRAAIAAAPWQARDKQAARGTAIHAMAEDLIAGKPVEVPSELAGHVNGLARWLEASGLVVVRNEAMVWADEDPDLGLCAFAGTADAIGIHPRHGYILLDWKTSAGVWPEHAIQVAAYAAADWIVADDRDKPMPQIDRLAVVHIRPDGTDMRLVPDEDRRNAAQRFELLRMLRNIPEPTIAMEATA